MPDEYRILLAKPVATDLEIVFEYIAQNSPQNAIAVVIPILSAIEGLKTFPHRAIAKGHRTKQPIRSLPIQSWVIFFKVNDAAHTVRILRVRHGRQRRPRRFD